MNNQVEKIKHEIQHLKKFKKKKANKKDRRKAKENN